MDYSNKQASVIVEKDRLDTSALEAALKEAGFGGKVLGQKETSEKKKSSTDEPEGDRIEKQEPKTAEGPAAEPERSVVIHVTGMLKSKSGAT